MTIQTSLPLRVAFPSTVSPNLLPHNRASPRYGAMPVADLPIGSPAVGSAVALVAALVAPPSSLDNLNCHVTIIVQELSPFQP
jgi:hypothetical protein